MDTNKRANENIQKLRISIVHILCTRLLRAYPSLHLSSNKDWGLMTWNIIRASNRGNKLVESTCDEYIILVLLI